MELQNIQIGQATYELHRIFQGPHPLSDLMAERLIQNLPTVQPVDEGGNHGV